MKNGGVSVLYDLIIDETEESEECMPWNPNASTNEKNGEINKDQYDRWRYTFPAEDTTQIWAKVPSQELSDMLVEAFKDDIK